MCIFYVEPVNKSILLESAKNVICSSTSLQLWRSKCLVLLISCTLCQNERVREDVAAYIESIFYKYILSDSHNEIRTCMFQSMEVLVQNQSPSWVSWFFAYLAKDYEEDRSNDSWIRWFQERISHPVDTHPFILQLSFITRNNLQYESLIHYSVDVCVGVRFATLLHNRVFFIKLRETRWRMKSLKIWIFFLHI